MLDADMLLKDAQQVNYSAWVNTCNVDTELNALDVRLNVQWNIRSDLTASNFDRQDVMRLFYT